MKSKKFEMLKYSFFIPCYNEEDKIEGTIKKVLDQLKVLRIKDYEVVIVNDCSTDNTGNIVFNFIQKVDRVNLINLNGSHPTRRENLAKAIKDYNELSGLGDYVVMLDADLSTDLVDLRHLINFSYEDDIIIGNRYDRNSVIKRKPFRYIVSRLVNGLTSFLFGTGLKDHFIGFKAFRKGIILDLINSLGYDNNFSRSMWWDAELLIRAKRKAYNIRSIPVIWIENKKSSLRLFTDIKILHYMIKFWMRSKWIN